MPVTIIRQDITKMKVDAIVNAAKSSLSGGGGVDGAIHAAAGPELDAACRRIGYCATGSAVLTPGFRLPAAHIIHTVGPVWEGGGKGEAQLLASCYRSSLELAAAQSFDTLAFPLISAGIFGYPPEQALKVAMDTIWEFLQEREMMVYLVLFGQAAFLSAARHYSGIESYVDSHYVRLLHLGEQSKPYKTGRRRRSLQEQTPFACCFPPADAAIAPCEETAENAVLPAGGKAELPQEQTPQGLAQALESRDESFAELLKQLIDSRQLTDAACYKAANITRQTFNKIINRRDYRPTRSMVFALAVGLKLTPAETAVLLSRAGYAFSGSLLQDVIVKYFIEHAVYDILYINEVLFSYDQPLLGSIAAE